MATLVRWNPVRDILAFNRTVDRFFDAPVVRRSRRWPVENGFKRLAVDVYENDEAVVVEATLPGIAPEQVDLQVEDGILTIKGAVKNASEDKDETENNYYVRERFHGAFERRVRLPDYVDADAAEAKFKNGLLTVAIPKAEAAKPRQIPVNAS